jgi:adenylate cyclase
MKYGVLGDGVNLASRLEELNKRYDTEVLVSEEVIKSQEEVSEAFIFRPVDLVVVKGRKMPTPIYSVLDYRPNCSKTSLEIETLTKEAMRSYRNRQFDKAMGCWEQVRKLKPDGKDLAGDVLVRRCKEFLLSPPPKDWDGSEVLTQKSF